MRTLKKAISEVISTALFEFHKNSRVEPLFVFPTEIEKNSWIDWAVKNPDESGVSAVSTERFIAWDEFKRSYAAAETQKDGKTCIPSLMRKIFAERLLQENAKKKFIKQIISKDLTGDALFGFTDWLSKILPSLKLWKKHYDNDFLKNVKNGVAHDDAENEDFNTIFSLYDKFLNSHNFYEPSFFEPAFKGDGNPIFIFYPEINEDWSEYIETLSKSDDIFIIPVPEINANEAENAGENEDETNENDAENENEAKDAFSRLCILYPDSRTEIRRVVLKIRKLWLSGADLNRIALSVPDLENIRPYIEREFRLYAVPASVRNGTPFTRNSGGDIFKKIKGCIDDNFSFEALRSLVNDGFLPWKHPELHLALLQAGIQFRCVCSVDSEDDTWEKSLEGKENCAAILSYYKKLKAAIEKFNRKNCRSFEHLEKAWAQFREEFIDSVKFRSIWQKEYAKAEYKNDRQRIEELDDIKDELEAYDLTDKILGQMITTLSDFSCQEREFCQTFPKAGNAFGLNDYLAFFTNEMDSTSYTVNEKREGVNIFAYKVAACADFDYHFIINANQTDITVPLNALRFITDDEKREQFGLEKNDASEKFIALYNSHGRLPKSSEKSHASSYVKKKEVFWSSAKVNFMGSAITHTALKEFDVTEAILNFENSEKRAAIDTKIKARLTSSFEKFDFSIENNTVVDSLDSLDFVRQDFQHIQNSSHTFSQRQKTAFENWKNANATTTASIDTPSLNGAAENATNKTERSASKSAAKKTALKGAEISTTQDALKSAANDTTNAPTRDETAEASEIPESLKQKISGYLGLKSGLISISASKLNAFFPCPKKWLFQNVMGIGDEKFSPLLAETNEIGTFYHKALENLFLHFGKTIPIYTETSQDNLAKIEQDVHKAIEKALTDEKILSSDVMNGALSKSAFQSQLPVVKKTLMDFALKICAPPTFSSDGTILNNGSYGGWTIEGLEIARTVFSEKYQCTGYIDCLLTRNGEPETAVIIDYKTGHIPNAGESTVNDDEKIKNFQMAMYVYLLEHACTQNEKVYKVKEGLFYSLQEKANGFQTNYVIAENPPTHSSIVTRDTFEPTLEAFTSYLENFTECVKKYEFKTSKNYIDKNYVNPNSDCIKCKFKSICRTSFTVGKRAL